MVPGQHHGPHGVSGVNKLDSAMSVLTNLLVDLEHELRDHSQPCIEPDGGFGSCGGGAVGSTAVPQNEKAPPMAPRGTAPPMEGRAGSARATPGWRMSAGPQQSQFCGAVNARADKLDSALSAPWPCLQYGR
mmetsp:Transcript_175472/g.557314  ORF Transcript_175472/g.557314 Transcript_175472/m.557314 type:complete len:132 (-) Transcript_175472:85-480(-)